MRIVSLLPACTEWVASFAATEELVGRSHLCHHPPAVKVLPAVTQPLLEEGSSAQISAAVRAKTKGGRALYRIDAELLARLEPDVILTQRQCDVYGVSLEDVEAALTSWRCALPALFAMNPATFKEVLDAGLRLGKTIGRIQEAMSFIAEQEMALRKARRAGAERPTVVCIEWIDPIMTAGRWVPDMVELAGGRAILATKGDASTYVDWGEIVEHDPDVIAVMPCGLSLEETRTELKALTKRPEWPGLKAVRTERVYAFDGRAYFNHPGPRLYRAIELLAEALRPGASDIRIEPWEMAPLKTWWPPES